MSRLNVPENFAGRVNYAAQVISKGANQTRAFDNCFENCDGDAVAAALMRRAEKNPKLRENMPRYLDMTLAQENYTRLAGKDLTEAARASRAKSREAFAAMCKAQDERNAQARAAPAS